MKGHSKEIPSRRDIRLKLDTVVPGMGQNWKNNSVDHINTESKKTHRTGRLELVQEKRSQHGGLRAPGKQRRSAQQATPSMVASQPVQRQEKESIVDCSIHPIGLRQDS
mmetsp:Transcript_29810/g.86819  ORF Transcript_29810/g.86819 Transcript_29810/m.86819 type:complete len:109 (+) Transcript_29810:246-572(+)